MECHECGAAACLTVTHNLPYPGSSMYPLYFCGWGCLWDYAESLRLQDSDYRGRDYGTT